MSTDNTDLDEVTNTKVKDFTNDIVEFLKKQEAVKDNVDVDFDNVINADHSLHALSAIITTKFGMVTVLPDFIKRKSWACIVHMGVIKGMQQEGFDEEYIQKEGHIYGSLLEYNKMNVKILGTYLSCKMDFSKK